MRNRALTILAGWIALVLVLGTAQAYAAVPTPTCWWEGTVLRAENLPEKWTATREPIPNGVSVGPSSIAIDFGASFTVYFWTRGGPYKALFKPGAQYNDYKPFCIATP